VVWNMNKLFFRNAEIKSKPLFLTSQVWFFSSVQYRNIFNDQNGDHVFGKQNSNQKNSIKQKKCSPKNMFILLGDFNQKTATSINKQSISVYQSPIFYVQYKNVSNNWNGDLATAGWPDLDNISPKNDSVWN
jgi:hypothetical protein